MCSYMNICVVCIYTYKYISICVCIYTSLISFLKKRINSIMKSQFMLSYLYMPKKLFVW